MDARVLEADLIARCRAVVAGTADARDARDANTFLLASMVLHSRLPQASHRLKETSDAYFSMHPSERVAVQEALNRGWVESLPRLRDMLTVHLTHAVG